MKRKRLFDQSNLFFTFMSKLGDIILISIMYIICCIPIITIGPATTALYYTTVKTVRRNRSYAFITFFKAILANLKNGLILTAALLLTSLILFFDCKYALSLLSNGDTYTQGWFMLVIFLILVLLLLFISVYLFPVLSRFNLKLWEILKVSFFLSMKHLASTILLIIIGIFSILSIYIFLFPVLFMPGLSTFLCSLLLESIFKKYTPGFDDDDTEDRWYLE